MALKNMELKMELKYGLKMKSWNKSSAVNHLDVALYSSLRLGRKLVERQRRGDLSFVLETGTHLNHNKDVNKDLLILFF